MVGHMELTSVASSGNVMITNAAVSPRGRLFGNFPRWTRSTCKTRVWRAKPPRASRPW